MKRIFVLVPGVFLFLALARSSAEYIVIRIDVSKDYWKSTGPAPVPGGGGASIGGGFGAGGMRGGAGLGGMRGGAGGGMRGGMLGGGGGGMLGMRGGMGGMRGGMLGGGNPPGGPPNPRSGPAEAEQPHWVYAFIEVRGKPRLHTDAKQQPTHLEFDHVFGKTCRVPIELIRLPYRPDEADIRSQVLMQPTIAKQYSIRLKEAVRRKDPANMLLLGQWALEHGLLDKFHWIMAELKKSKDRPAGVSAALAAYDRVKKAMQVRPTDEDVGHAALIAELVRDGYQTYPSPEGHYTLLHNLPRAGQDDVLKPKAELMEETFEKFFYWFALHGQDVVPPVPTRRLLAVIVASPKEFQEKHLLWGSLPVIGDGFLPRRDNIMMLSAEHLDDAYALLKRNNKEHLRSVNREDLLSGAVWKNSQPRDFANISYLQTQVLVERAMEAEGERVTVTHEGTRQLLFATGLLPHNVDVPEWIQYGLSSFFETPPGGKFYPGLGIPSWSNLLQFKYYQAKKKIKPTSSLVYQVVTDQFFRRARDAAALLDAAKDSKALADKAQEEQAIAQATSWALVYFLAKQNQLKLLLQYSQELDRLPRDLELGEGVLRGCFRRAFALNDPAHMKQFAEAWFSAMSSDELEIPEYGRDYLAYLLNPPRSRPPTDATPGAPGGLKGGP